MRPTAFIAAIVLAAGLAGAQAPVPGASVKVGEVAAGSAMVWVRLQAATGPRQEGLVPGTAAWRSAYRAGLSAAEQAKYDRNESLGDVGNTLVAGLRLPVWIATSNLVGSCAGVPGSVRLRYGREPDLADAAETDWAVVGTNADCAHTFRLQGLAAGAEYAFEAQCAWAGGASAVAGGKGRFRTAAPPDRSGPLCFAVIAGQNDQRADMADPVTGRPLGFRAYDALSKLAPDFVVPAGNMLYYDRGYWAEFAWSRDMARYRWQRAYGLPNVAAFYARVPAYWARGAHDTLKAGGEPGARLGSLTWAEGLAVFREQVPLGERAYRTVRWGKALQVWITESREFRSPGSAPDGPGKTLLGEEQKSWLKRTLLESDATWKIWVSPTPVVGPDRELAWNDNLAGPGFLSEGTELRTWLRNNLAEGFFVICGETAWQQHAIDPITGVQEFACGPLSGGNAGGRPRQASSMQRFVRTDGGFLTVTVSPVESQGSRIAFRFHDVDGKAIYEAQWTRASGAAANP